MTEGLRRIGEELVEEPFKERQFRVMLLTSTRDPDPGVGLCIRRTPTWAIMLWLGPLTLDLSIQHLREEDRRVWLKEW
jgi:hypothetical protein